MAVIICVTRTFGEQRADSEIIEFIEESVSELRFTVANIFTSELCPTWLFPLVISKVVRSCARLLLNVTLLSLTPAHPANLRVSLKFPKRQGWPAPRLKEFVPRKIQRVPA